MANMNKLPSDYRSFRISLHVDFDGKYISNKKTLEDLMNIHDYGKRTRGGHVKSTQIEFAWNELHKEFPTQVFFRIKGYRTIATENITYKGKNYRKGMYLPKRIRYNERGD
jgi:hypothetical protein